MVMPRGPSHFVNAAMRELGWYEYHNGQRPLNLLLGALGRQLRNESLMRLRAHESVGGGSRPTGQEQDAELQRRFGLVKLYAISKEWRPDVLADVLGRIADDSEALLKEVNAWDGMPSVWRATYGE